MKCFWVTVLKFIMRIINTVYLHFYKIFTCVDVIFLFQIWRPFTALLFYPITPSTGFHFLINLYFLYNYSLRLETGQWLQFFNLDTIYILHCVTSSRSAASWSLVCLHFNIFGSRIFKTFIDQVGLRLYVFWLGLLRIRMN